MEMKVKDVTALLNVSEKSIYRWIKSDGFPYYRINGQYRFSKAEILEWATENKINVTPQLMHDPAPENMSSYTVSNALKNGGIHYHVEGKTKEEVVYNTVQYMQLPDGMDRETLYQFLIAREKMGTTAVGKGIAIPHVRNPVVLHVDKPSIALCFLDEPVDFDAMDKEPVKILFTLLTPSIQIHLHLLSLLAYMLNHEKVRDLLEKCAKREEIFKTIKEIELSAISG
ncbi:MAG: hypothetical protein A2014_07180 [Spirochaetes bacterium GWF1_49_6]|nr:MAG: hypothetical protein A2014_07180 [Spirochaetes bacterium GWF1_49_6]